MNFSETNLKGAYVIDIEAKTDSRGFFARAWCENEFKNNQLVTRFVQANIAGSARKGTLRGMHYQQAPFSEAKLIRCLKGKIFDVMIDLRTESPSFRQWFGIELTPENHRMVYVPEMFAHGYLSLCDDTEVFYQVSAFYTPEAERGLRWDDPAIGIQWPITTGLVISEKDLNWPYLNR